MRFFRNLFSQGDAPKVAPAGSSELLRSVRAKAHSKPTDPKQPVREFGSQVKDAVFLDAQTVVTCGNHKIEVFTVQDGVSKRLIDCDGSSLERISISENKSVIATCGQHFAPKGAGTTYDRGEAIVWDNWKRVDLPRFEASVGDMIFMPDGKRVACFSYRHSGGHFISTVELSSLKILNTVNLKAPGTSPQVSPCGRRFVFVSEARDGYEHEILVFDNFNSNSDLNTPSLRLKQPGKYLRVRFLDDDRLVCLARLPKQGGQSYEYTGLMYVWNVSTGERITALLAPDLVSYWEVLADAAVHPNRQFIAVSVRWSEVTMDRSGKREVRSGGDIGIINTANWSLVSNFGAHPENIQDVHFSPDGTYLISIGPAKPQSGYTVRLWPSGV